MSRTLPYPPVSLEDLRPISAEEHAAAREAILAGKLLIAWRGENASALDPETDFPAGNWQPGSPDNDFMEAVRHLGSADHDTINHLRYYTNTLVGMKLFYFCPNAGMRSVMPLPPSPRELIASNLHRLELLIDHYLHVKSCLPHEMIISPPWCLGEVGANIAGVIVNQDTVRQQATVATLWRSGVLGFLRRRVAEAGTAHVVEIGAGHGALCLHLKRIIPELTYHIIDIPETLLFSGAYLAVTATGWPLEIAAPEAGAPVRRGGIHLVPNYQLEALLARLPGVDLAINISSFGEMAPAQVARYARGLSGAMFSGGLVFETNELGHSHINARATEALARHFAFSQRTVVSDVLQFEGATWMHANRPLNELVVPVPPHSPSFLRSLWDRFRSQPLSQLPARLFGKLRRLLGV